MSRSRTSTANTDSDHVGQIDVILSKKFRFYFLSKMRAIFIREIDVFLKFFSKFYQQNFFTGENTQFFKIFVDFVF